MRSFTMVGEPTLINNRLTWQGVLDPGGFEMLSQGASTDTIQCWKMTANDPAGLDTHSVLALEVERWLPHDVMPGDGYENNFDLDGLGDGYYHLVLTLDANCAGPSCQFNVRIEGGVAELETWHALA